MVPHVLIVNEGVGCDTRAMGKVVAQVHNS